jgi:periplasmic copper chaperone A
MKNALRVLSVAILVSGVSSLANAAELKFHDAWIAAAPPVATTQAAYICFVNDGDKDVEITAVNAKGFAMAMIHKTMMHGDMAMMEMMPTLLIPAHKMVTLEPGSMHIMLMDPVKVVVPGDKVALTVQYSDGTQQTFNLDVKETADALDNKKSDSKNIGHDHGDKSDHAPL